MSVNRENVVWLSADGTWNRAFYDFYYTGDSSDEDFDHEWDVEYTDEFNWVRTGLASEDAAWDCWTGANPGGGSVITDPTHAAELDAAAKEFLTNHR